MKLSPFKWKDLSFPLIAVDEVGRGCLAGPVVAAAVLITSKDLKFDRRITDSKKLGASVREELAEIIRLKMKTAIGWATPQEIDEINILQASFLAMERAIAGLGVTEGFVLVDGKFTIPGLPKSFEQMALIKGDLRAKPIGAASILAKVYRDQLMTELAKELPTYGFEIHKGYPTAAHKAAIRAAGITIHHRRSFRGVVEDGDFSAELREESEITLEL